MSKWVETRLGELININPETLSVSKYNGEIEYIDIASVNSGRLEGYTTYEVTEAPSRARRIIKNNDIIFSTVRPNLKAYYYVKNCPQNAICSTGFAVLRAKKGINSRFVYSLVTENSFVDYLSLVAKGSAYPAVDTNDFKKAKIYVPDLPTQEKIADIQDEQKYLQVSDFFWWTEYHQYHVPESAFHQAYHPESKLQGDHQTYPYELRFR